MDNYNSSKILKAALNKSGMFQKDLADKLDVGQSSIAGNMNRSKIGLNVFAKMLDAMGYTVAVGKKTDAGFEAIWEVEWSDDD